MEAVQRELSLTEEEDESKDEFIKVPFADIELEDYITQLDN